MSENSSHPLNILSASEISDAVSVLKKFNKDHENSSFSYISLNEPDKKLLKESTYVSALLGAVPKAIIQYTNNNQLGNWSLINYLSIVCSSIRTLQSIKRRPGRTIHSLGGSH